MIKYKNYSDTAETIKPKFKFVEDKVEEMRETNIRQVETY